MFALHPKLAEDTFPLGDFPLSRLLMMNDANYPWFILVPRRAAIREIYQLEVGDQQQLLKESSHLARQMSRLFRADKINIAALGNMVPQLHVHHVARYHQDISWPDPVWGKAPPLPYGDERVFEIRALLTSNLAELRPSLS
jgi:diadenosine tetraphosphate (Ap4A) HIT family hydrolase